ncbi:hypothetical protein EPUS_03701 [Endocarpon pusillum Z07020]|uniref:RBR-type E3 ubiquitin transferase n=1 Tax=Endocarpon pusillum (strain Z07020 / HMAS-L-300199) TaxID=1263415 RepID=U1HL62_ENDPU|nr:uncharacterized protein EPUS_03701 [Endocarpon pusillum Z07020]ERF69709.1 hypothetical protein EPUS_03701 [Endocarpon pusillum Z07020]
MPKRKSAKAVIRTSKPSTVIGKRKRTEVETKECAICVESQPVYRNFPTFTTCSHDSDTCLSCIAKQTVILLQASRGKGWSASRCPQCNISIPTEELQSALPRALVKEMKEMVSKAAQATDDSWRWCLRPGCGHGKIHDGRSEMIQCGKCSYKMCFKHQVPWHQGYSCQDYETSHPQAAITKTNEEMIQKMSKPCPGCGIAVEKIGGCNHMSCRECGSSWLWESPSSAGGTVLLAGPREFAPPLPQQPIDLPNIPARWHAIGQLGPFNPQMFQPPPNLNRPTNAVIRHSEFPQHAREEQEGPRPQRSTEQSITPASQPQVPVTWARIDNTPFFRRTPPQIRALWSTEDVEFRFRPPIAGSVQTPIDLTGDDDMVHMASGQRSRR